MTSLVDVDACGPELAVGGGADQTSIDDKRGAGLARALLAENGLEEYAQNFADLTVTQAGGSPFSLRSTGLVPRN